MKHINRYNEGKDVELAYLDQEILDHLKQAIDTLQLSYESLGELRRLRSNLIDYPEIQDTLRLEMADMHLEAKSLLDRVIKAKSNIREYLQMDRDRDIDLA